MLPKDCSHALFGALLNEVHHRMGLRWNLPLLAHSLVAQPDLQPQYKIKEFNRFVYEVSERSVPNDEPTLNEESLRDPSLAPNEKRAPFHTQLRNCFCLSPNPALEVATNSLQRLEGKKNSVSAGRRPFALNWRVFLLLHALFPLLAIDCMTHVQH